MRVEPFSVGSYIHVVKRGARGVDIVRDSSDYWRFLRLLFFMNDVHVDHNWMIVTNGASLFERPPQWPNRDPLVDIEGFTLMPNHFHLLIKEIKEDGVSLFMKKLGQSMSEHANMKYKEKGSLFQGSYRSRTIDSDTYLRYVAVYVMVKNVFELYPKGGLSVAKDNFEDAWKWAVEYNFSSMATFVGKNKASSTLLCNGALRDIFDNPLKFKEFSREVIESGKWQEVSFE